jgi:hypothetical protein
MVKIKRTDVPSEIAAETLFKSDRTCCVCRDKQKPTQIHHIDGNPNNHIIKNLAVLCFDCHNKTLIRGGFDRKLDSDQIILYRDDWHQLVIQQRAAIDEKNLKLLSDTDKKIQLITARVEQYQENKEYELLASLYNSIGNKELRDKYIEIAINDDPSDSNIIFLRSLQDKQDQIPQDVIDRQYQTLTKNNDLLQRASLNYRLGRFDESAIDYIDGIHEIIHDKGRTFTVAYYLKELCEKGLVDQLFISALKLAKENDELWWQVRALQELGWQDEIKKLLLENKEKILKSGHPFLIIQLERAQGNYEKAMDIEKRLVITTKKNRKIHKITSNRKSKRISKK